MKWNEAKAKRKLDRLFSSYILFRDNRTCKCCGKTKGRMNTSHIIPKQCLFLRWNSDNALTLCYKCHLWMWHKSPLEGVRWLESFIGIDKCNKLLSNSRIPFEFNEEVFNNMKQSYDSIKKFL